MASSTEGTFMCLFFDYGLVLFSVRALESKLEYLKAESGPYSNVEYDSSRTVSVVPVQNLYGAKSYRRQTLEGALSDSLTQEVSTNSSSDGRVQLSVSAEETKTKLGIPKSSKRDKDRKIDMKLQELCRGQGGFLKKKRGVRKRKNCVVQIKEGSVGESQFLGPADVFMDSQSRKRRRRETVNDLMRIFDSVVEHKSANIFYRRLNCQKRGRYKRLIRQHMDFHTIRSRITSLAITSSTEVFRDLLLVANNSLVFYSKRTREHKSALLLRDIVTQKLRQHYKGSNFIHAETPVRPRSAVRCRAHKLPPKASNANSTVWTSSVGSKRADNSDSSPSAESSAIGNRSSITKWRRKRENTSDAPRSVRSNRGRKRVRTR
ncbi:Bromo domain-containing protein [Psidium guajava]|nr:Bromo domain-containing protein [Psidium guajava]